MTWIWSPIGEDWPMQIVLWTPHVCCNAHTHTHRHTKCTCSHYFFLSVEKSPFGDFHDLHPFLTSLPSQTLWHLQYLVGTTNSWLPLLCLRNQGWLSVPCGIWGEQSHDSLGTSLCWRNPLGKPVISDRSNSYQTTHSSSSNRNQDQGGWKSVTRVLSLTQIIRDALQQ